MRARPSLCDARVAHHVLAQQCIENAARHPSRSNGGKRIMHTTKLDATGEYQMFPPRTDAETVALGTVFKTHESSLPVAQQVCPRLLPRLGELLVDAQAA